ncbi:MAG: DUF4236 domain-containing protein [Frankia sp.]|nr:DUF4236 domain-containing protein [Frankia sp.]
MSLHYSRRSHFGPFHVHVTENGVSSVTLRLGRVSWQVWSRHRRRPGLSRINLPGGFYYRRDRRH